MAFVAGNAGGSGPFSGENPGEASSFATVGSSDNTATPCYQWKGTMMLGVKNKSFRFTPGQVFNFQIEGCLCGLPRESSLTNHHLIAHKSSTMWNYPRTWPVL